MVAELGYWVAFTLVPGVGPLRFKRLLEHFGDAERAWHAGAKELSQAGLDARTLEALLQARGRIEPAEELERLYRQGVSLLTWEDAEYPARLKEIYDPPPVLFMKGKLLLEDEWCLAVVGTRGVTAYGRQATEAIAGDLARNRITVVSGLARGVDGIAHQAALAAGGRTIAVLACGLDKVYPPEHAKLAAQICEAGALLSSYPLGTEPEGSNFPARNRIISGLSLGVLVVEAGERSGALITAGWAVEQNREVFAVPGSIFSAKSTGPNRLIQDGAKAVLCCDDILEELNLQMAGRQMEMRELLPANEVEAALLHHLSTEPTHIDEVGRLANLPIAAVSSALAMMELKGMVRCVGAMNYVVAH